MSNIVPRQHYFVYTRFSLIVLDHQQLETNFRFFGSLRFPVGRIYDRGTVATEQCLSTSKLSKSNFTSCLGKNYEPENYLKAS